jgi:hypothetical protein
LHPNPESAGGGSRKNCRDPRVPDAPSTRHALDAPASGAHRGPPSGGRSVSHRHPGSSDQSEFSRRQKVNPRAADDHSVAELPDRMWTKTSVRLLLRTHAAVVPANPSRDSAHTPDAAILPSRRIMPSPRKQEESHTPGSDRGRRGGRSHTGCTGPHGSGGVAAAPVAPKTPGAGRSGAQAASRAARPSPTCGGTVDSRPCASGNQTPARPTRSAWRFGG